MMSGQHVVSGPADVARLMPNARFELIEGAEHVIWFSRPEELKSLLRTFIGDVGWWAQHDS